jgi:hypothetical protein
MAIAGSFSIIICGMFPLNIAYFFAVLNKQYTVLNGTYIHTYKKGVPHLPQFQGRNRGLFLQPPDHSI